MENWKKNLAQNVNWRTAKASEALNVIRLSLDKWVKRSDLALPFSHLKNWFHTFLFSFCINHWNDKKAPQIFGFILWMKNRYKIMVISACHLAIFRALNFSTTIFCTSLMRCIEEKKNQWPFLYYGHRIHTTAKSSQLQQRWTWKKDHHSNTSSS